MGIQNQRNMMYSSQSLQGQNYPQYQYHRSLPLENAQKTPSKPLPTNAPNTMQKMNVYTYSYNHPWSPTPSQQQQPNNNNNNYPPTMARFKRSQSHHHMGNTGNYQQQQQNSA